MAKIKEVSSYNGTSWGTPVPIGANDVNIDITSSTTNPTDTTATSAGLVDSNVTVVPGDTAASAWTKFNRFRKRVQNAFGNFAGVTLRTAYNTSNIDTSVYTTGVINNYMSNVIGYTGTTAPSAGTVAVQLNSLNSNLNSALCKRLKGKKIAIYADSWGNSNCGSLGKDYLEEVTGNTVHISWQGSLTMAQIYSDCWDNYNADIYIINGGLNDFSKNITINAYKTAINNFVTAIRLVNSNSEIYFITPEFIRTSTQQTQLYPLEAYRSAIWGLKNLYKYNVINSLKWVDISYQSDNVHPLITDANTIGAYITSALINYGDNETHITEFTTLNNLKSNQLILYMIGGSPYLYFQQFTATANSTDRYPIDITALSYDMGFFQLGTMNGKTGDPAVVYHVISDVNTINVYSKGVGTGNEISVNGLLIPTYFRPLVMPNSF